MELQSSVHTAADILVFALMQEILKCFVEVFDRYTLADVVWRSMHTTHYPFQIAGLALAEWQGIVSACGVLIIRRTRRRIN